MGSTIPFVRSVIETSEYDRLINVAFWPGGQVSVVGGGVSVKLPFTDPFFTLNVPAAFVWATVVVFFGSEGTLFPPFTHESSRVAVAEAS